MTRHLILGGARSGKSRYAMALAQASGLEKHCVVTARADDREMAERIAWHRRERDASWTVHETHENLAACLRDIDAENRVIVVDCLTLWLTQALLKQRVETEISTLLANLPQLRAQCLLVSNEVGSGVVPLGELSRHFVDSAGRLHQQLAQLCDTVSLVVAGLPLSLKASL